MEFFDGIKITKKIIKLSEKKNHQTEKLTNYLHFE